MGYVLLALIAMTVMGVADLLLKMGMDAGAHFVVFMFYIYSYSALFFGVFCLVKKVKLKMDKNLVRYSLVIGLLIFVGTFLILLALKDGSASVVIPIGRMGFVVTAVCAFLFLKEKVTLQKGLGLFCAAVSLVLLSI